MIDVKKGMNVLDIIGRLFVNEINEILQTGLLKRHIPQQAKLHFLEGKLDRRMGFETAAKSVLQSRPPVPVRGDKPGI